MEKIRVLIGSPRKGDIPADYCKTLAKLCASELPGVLEFEHMFMGGTCVFGARDILANEALKGGYDRLIFWDTDLKPTPADFVRLLSHGEELVCAPYCARITDTRWHFYPISAETDILPSGLWEMNQAAIGFSSISCSLLRKIKDRHPESTYANQEQGAGKMQLHQFFPWQIVGPNTPREKMERLKTLLDGRLDHAYNAGELLGQIRGIVDADDYSANLMQGEDYAFCRLAREVGAKIWLDTKLPVAHLATCELPIPHDDLVKMILEPWRQDHWAKLRAERVEKPVSV